MEEFKGEELSSLVANVSDDDEYEIDLAVSSELPLVSILREARFVSERKKGVTWVDLEQGLQLHTICYIPLNVDRSPIDSEYRRRKALKRQMQDRFFFLCGFIVFVLALFFAAFLGAIFFTVGYV